MGKVRFYVIILYRFVFFLNGVEVEGGVDVFVDEVFLDEGGVDVFVSVGEVYGFWSINYIEDVQVVGEFGGVRGMYNFVENEL